MRYPDKNIPVVIVGGGPVGLFTGILLLKNGINCRILEKRAEPVEDSRSLGIHPPSLTLFDELGILKPFLDAGIKIEKGIASTGTHKLGEINFSRLPKPFNYILACPQFKTEILLRETLNKLAPNCLLNNTEFINFKQNETAVEVHFRDENEQQQHITCNFLIGCDGKNSKVRKQASIHYSGTRYPDTYIMGDFEDTTDFGNEAMVFLPGQGLIESFPLPDGMRRWVVKTDTYISQPSAEMVMKRVEERIGFKLNGATSTMISSFGVQHYMAESLVKKRVLLAGDAAHVVSPIGGQGMNLGWLGAWKLGKLLIEHRGSLLSESANLSLLYKYDLSHRKAVRKAARRAELNMYLGRAYVIPEIRNVIVRGMLSRFFHQKVAGLFTMKNLEPE
jgi:2-polyprenyl-6-methoxyphenol hydroxylase-like FAD-dependent oxidoreductase